MFSNLQEKIEFKDNYIDKREEEIMKIINKYNINDTFILHQNGVLRLNFNHKSNKHINNKDKINEILEQFRSLSFVNKIQKYKNIYLIYHSSDIRRKLHKFYKNID